jgi:diguanylate cyclase (GGDEF)-like protein/PAS domain S-box-containing protein
MSQTLKYRIRWLLRVTVVALVLISLIGGGVVYRLMGEVGKDAVSGTQAVVALGRNMDGAELALRAQVQEWKNLLLRGRDPQLFENHVRAFHVHHDEVQASLKGLVGKMTERGFDTAQVLQIQQAHLALLARYEDALARFPLSGHPENYLQADSLVRGIDRQLQADLETLDKSIDELVIEQTGGVNDRVQGQHIWQLYFVLGLMLVLFPLVSLASFGAIARMTRRLQEEKERFHVTLNSIGDAVLVTDLAGAVDYLNPVAEAMTGWTLDEARGRPLPECFNIVNEETRKRVSNPVETVLREGRVVGLANHTVLIARHGGERAIEDSAAPVCDPDGKLCGVVLVFHDATQQREAQKRERQRFDEQAAVYRLGIAVSRTDVVEEVYEAAKSSILDVLKADRVSILLFDAAGVMRFKSWHGLSDVYRQAAEGHSPWTQDAIDPEPILVDDVELDADWAHFRPVAAQEGIRTFGFIPLLHRKRLFGKFMVYFNRPHHFVESEIQLAKTIASHIGFAIARKLAEESLLASEQRFRDLTEMSSDFYWESDAEHRLTQRSESKRETTEGVFRQASSVGKRRWEIAYLSPDEAAWQAHRALLDAHLPFRNFEILRLRANGAEHHISVSGNPVFNAAGEFTGYRGVGADITERKQAEAEIGRLTFYDALTRLPNRGLLLDRLKQALSSSTRNQRYGALLLIDLDNFRTLNDTLGTDIGDQLLQQVALRLSTCIREGDTVARLGGDEFVVMLENLSEQVQESAAQAKNVGEKIIAALNPIYSLASCEHHSTASIGVTLFMNHQGPMDELLKRADLAMLQAKAAGRNSLRFFEPEMQAAVTARAALEADLREAVQKEQFLLYYQAQVVGDGRLTGVEALLRWQHPRRGLVSPAEFIPLAEETGLILPLGQWVLQTACTQLALWASQPQRAQLTVGVNVSAHQFHHRDFVAQVLAVLDQTGANPQRLKLELTESLLVSNVEDVIAKMTALKARGVGFSLDDFGTGYSSLSYLKRLPIDQLKIDQSFIRDILTDPNDAAIAKMIIALAESMGLAVIAEGVELEAQRDFLARQGCYAYQGYLFSRPLSLEKFEEFCHSTDH